MKNKFLLLTIILFATLFSVIIIQMKHLNNLGKQIVDIKLENDNLKLKENLNLLEKGMEFLIIDSTSKYFTNLDTTIFKHNDLDERPILVYRFFGSSCLDCITNTISLIRQILDIDQKVFILGQGMNLEQIIEYVNYEKLSQFSIVKSTFENSLPTDVANIHYMFIIEKKGGTLLINNVNFIGDFNNALIGYLKYFKGVTAINLKKKYD